MNELGDVGGEDRQRDGEDRQRDGEGRWLDREYMGEKQDGTTRAKKIQ